VSGRLAGEFHVKLADLSGNRLLRRYLGEVVSRCSLIWRYMAGRIPRRSVKEHREVVAALRGRNAGAATAVMEHHLGLVEHRALSDDGRDAQFDLGAVLSRYAERLETATATKVTRLPKRKDTGVEIDGRTEDDIYSSVHTTPRGLRHLRSNVHDQIFDFAPFVARRGCCKSVRVVRPCGPAAAAGITVASSMSAPVRTTAGTRPMRFGAKALREIPGVKVVEERTSRKPWRWRRPWSR